MQDIPTWLSFSFILCCLFALFCFHTSNGKSLKLTAIVAIWAVVHAGLALQGFYENTTAVPPRFALVIPPAFVLIIWGCLPRNAEWLERSRNTRWSTLLHTVRIGIELVLWKLAALQWVPELMTFEGRNFDILIGISAIPVAYLVWRQKLGRNTLLVWNVLGLGFVLFILCNGILSSELPFQQFAFEQPNRAVTIFPFVLLPALVVPIVIWSHLSDILILLRAKDGA